MNAYRTIFFGHLVQDSALSIGGNEPHQRVDDPLCRDGQNRFILRGTGLAGALLATARKYWHENQLRPIGLSPAPDKKKIEYDLGPEQASVWRVFNAHPLNNPQPEYRQGVGIRHDTGAAREKALFDIETLPRGTCWQFILEVDTRRGSEEIEGIAAHVLELWQQGLAWLGRNPARGMGWVHLEKLRYIRLKDEDYKIWPDSHRDPWEVLNNLDSQPFNLSDFNPPPKDREWHYYDIRGYIHVGDDKDDYGLDAISIGGHGSGLINVEWNSKHFLAPQDLGAMPGEFEPDAMVIVSRHPEEKWAKPFIPGSSLRGPLRHCLSAYLRTEGIDVPDPVLYNEKDYSPPDQEKAKSLDKLFGNMEDSARLLIQDAHLVESDDWYLAWLHQHAEDEFSRGVYGSSKFDRVAVLKGCFAWRMVLDCHYDDQSEEIKQWQDWLDLLLHYGERAQIGIGGQQWRGLGWPYWAVEKRIKGGEYA